MELLGWTPFHARLHQRLKLPLLDNRSRARAGGRATSAGAADLLLPKGEQILMAVSGGQDSLALVALLQVLQRPLQPSLASGGSCGGGTGGPIGPAFGVAVFFARG
jgi:hypothetical protein